MIPKPSYSVIIPVHNRHDLLRKTLSSVAGQSVPKTRLEVIIVDEASSPPIDKRFVDSIFSFPRLRLIRNRRALGPSMARNIGLKLATGNFIFFLDSDDSWDRDFINSLAPLLSGSGPRLATTLGLPQFFGILPPGQKFKYFFLTFLRNFLFILFFLFTRQQLPPSWLTLLRLSNTGFNRQAISRVKFSLSYRTAEDWKFFWDCIRTNHPVIYILPFVLAWFSFHPRSETSRRKNYFSYYRRLVNEFPRSISQSLGVKLFRFYANLAG